MVVTNSAPVADPNGPYLVPVGGTVRFDGSGSSDPDGDTITYAWTEAGGTLDSNTLVNPTFTPGTTPGIYPVTLVVTDEHGAVSAPASTTVVVYDPAGGFVTGGGWIMSPARAYVADATLEGKGDLRLRLQVQEGCVGSRREHRVPVQGRRP
jgi:PKD repeat protein